MSGLYFVFINTCQPGFFFFVFLVLIEQVPIDLKNPCVDSGCWALIPFHGGMICVKLQLNEFHSRNRILEDASPLLKNVTFCVYCLIVYLQSQNSDSLYHWTYQYPSSLT